MEIFSLGLELNADGYVQGADKVERANQRATAAMREAAAEAKRVTTQLIQEAEREAAAFERKGDRVTAALWREVAEGHRAGEEEGRAAAERLRAHFKADIDRTAFARSAQNARVRDEKTTDETLIQQAKKFHAQQLAIFKADQGAVRQAAVTGMLDKRGAKEAARANAEAYNQAITTYLKQHGATLQMMGTEGQAAFGKIAGSLQTVTGASGRAAVSMTRVREGMTTILASSLHAVPGVTQLSSAIGAMSLGTGVMIGVLAGAAALSFAWKGLTRHASELKAEVDKAREAIDNMNRSENEINIERINKLGEMIDKNREKSTGWRNTAGQVLGAMPGPLGTLGSLFSRQAGTAATDAAADMKRVQKVEDDMAANRSKNLKKQADDIRAAADAARRARAQEIEDIVKAAEFETMRADAVRDAIRIEHEITDALNRGNLSRERQIELLGQQAKLIKVINDAQAANAIWWRGAFGQFNVTPNLAGPSVTGNGPGGLRTVRSAGGLTEDTTWYLWKKGLKESSKETTGFFSNIMKGLKETFNPSQFLTGLITGGASSVLSLATKGISSLVDSIFDFSGKAAAAAAAQKAYSKELDRAIASFGMSDSQRAQQDAVDRIRQRLEGFEEHFNQVSGFDDLDTIEEFLARMGELAATSFANGGRNAEEWQKLMEYARRELERYNKTLEEAAQAAAKAAEEERRINAQKRTDFLANLQEREAALSGNDAEALRVRKMAQNAQELAAAQELLEKGVITEDLFKRLADVLGGELEKALKDTAAAAQAAAEAAAKQARTWETQLLDWESEMFKTPEAALGAFDAKMLDMWNEWAKGGASKEMLDRFNKYWLFKRDELLHSFDKSVMEEDARRGLSSRDDVVASVSAISESTGLRLVGIQFESKGLLAAIEQNTRLWGQTGQGAVRAGGRAVFVTVNTYGPIYADSDSAGSKIGRDAAREINRALGELAQEEDLRNSNSTV